MKRLILLLLVLSAALAQCSELASSLESAYGGYALMPAGSIDCSRPLSPELYANLSQLAEGYIYVAQCFKEHGDAAKAGAYYALAASKYTLASTALCTTDFSLQAQLWISAGDAYQKANQPTLARESYNGAISVYQAHAAVVDSSYYATAQQRLYEMDHPIAESIGEVGDTNQTDWVPLAIAGIVFVGIGLVIFSLKK